jgi:Flp pilus assembly protein TadD
MSKIFISYRRDDSADVSGRLYDRLALQFGKDRLFKDVDNIPLGEDFLGVLRTEIEQSDVMLVIIGRQWLTVKDARGRQRLASPDDPVRIEVETALTRGIPVIPVLVQNAMMPKASDLPKSMRAFASCNGIAVHADPHFHSDVDLLVDRLPLSEVLIAKAEALMDEEEHDEALRLFQRATELAPNDANVWVLFGSAYYEADRYLDALRAFDRALSLDTSDADGWVGRGDALRHLGRYEEALAAYDHALTLDANDPEAWDGKGKTFLMLERYGEALAAFDRAVALDAVDAGAWINKGVALSYLQRDREALVAYDRTLTLEPDSAIWLNKASSLRKLHRMREAEEAERRAAELEAAENEDDEDL